MRRSALLFNLDVIFVRYYELLETMQTQKTFIKKTRRGNIIKVVREHYLRDDIWCGSPLCQVSCGWRTLARDSNHHL